MIQSVYGGEIVWMTNALRIISNRVYFDVKVGLIRNNYFCDVVDIDAWWINFDYKDRMLWMGKYTIDDFE